MKFRSYLLGLMLLCQNSYGQDNIRFKNLTVQDGLSYSLVFEILKDTHGFMWFGSTDGLNKFDGYHFTTYQNIPGDTMSIPDNSVWALYEDSNGNLWVGTDGGGLSLYDRYADTFITFQNDPDNPQSLPHNSVNDIIEDNEGYLWIGTYGGGLVQMINPGIFKHYSNEENDPTSLSDDLIHDLFVDANGELWVSTQNGLNLFDKETESFFRYHADEQTGNGLKNDNILSVAEDEKGIIWLGTWGGGLYSFDRSTSIFQQYLFQDQENNRVPFVFIDDVENIWAGFLGKGLVSVDPVSGELTSFQNDRLDQKSIVNDNIWFIYQDDLDNIWLGTEGGISWFNIKDQPIKSFGISSLVPVFSNTVITKFDETDDGKIVFSTENEVGYFEFTTGAKPKARKLTKAPEIWSSVVCENGEVWVTAYGYGVYRYDQNLNLINTYTEFDGHEVKNATYLYEDGQGLVWIGTYGSGLIRYDLTRSESYFYSLLDSGAIRSPPVLNITDADTDNLWIGTYGDGLLLLDKSNGKYRKFNEGNQGELALSHGTVLSVLTGENGVIWVGTDGGGLNRLDTRKNKVELLTTEDGLPSNVILGIIEDEKGYLWLSSNNGITKYAPESGEVKNYSEEDGLVSKGFNADAYFKASNGYLLFGSGNGFNYFHPDSLKPKTFSPPVYFTGLKILNKPQNLDGKKLTRHINFNDKITLNHKENFFTLEFAALDYQAPLSNQYAYRLDGFNTDWIYTSASDRQATFTNLDHGEYVLEVKATNSDGVWSDRQAKMMITILPAPWETWWAYSLYGLLFISALGLVIRTFIVRERLKSNLKVEQLERMKILELDEMKTRFFTSISHEFRTPLTLITSPLDRLMKRAKEDKETLWLLNVIKNNTARLLRLINQLLDLAKLEAGKLILSVRKDDILGWIKVVIESFHELSRTKQVDFIVDIPSGSFITFYDRERLEQVVLNLLFNAFKFASTYVNFQVEIGDVNIKIVVINDGATIPAEDQEAIFSRFYQSKSDSMVEGTGLGLALVKEFTELHHGQVSVTSDSATTTFSISIPTKDDVYQDDQKIDIEKTKVHEAVRQQESEEFILDASNDGKDQDTILVVEDNADLQKYLAFQLGEKYLVKVAGDGKEGLNSALESVPDLIITDLMMPEMDGIELLSRLRKDIATSHIPVIMLTAKTEKEPRLAGLEIGADHYLIKPFDTDELMVRVHSLLIQRSRIRDHHYHEFLLNPKAENIPSMEDEFLKKAIDTLEEELSNHEFSVDQFAKRLAMSRVQLHRKMKAVIGCSVSEFVRNYRLKKAYHYLKSRKGHVSQIAYSVGFNNLSYFTRAFKSVYQINPSDVLKSES